MSGASAKSNGRNNSLSVVISGISFNTGLDSIQYWVDAVWLIDKVGLGHAVLFHVFQNTPLVDVLYQGSLM